MSFLDKDEKEPVVSNYMRFEKGNNTFRVLSSAITGMEYWKTVRDDDGKESRKPIRVKMGVNIPIDELETNDQGELEMPKYFWSFVVWNRDLEKVQILHLTQATIRKPIRSLVSNKKWGDVKQFDITVVKEGEGWNTEYTVTPNPKEKIDPGIVKLYKDLNINLDALWEGKDPFASDNEGVDSEQLAKDAEEALGA